MTYADLPQLEIFTYFYLWVFGVLYSIYNVYCSGQELSQYAGEFTTGWSWLGRKKDISDYEWNSWTHFLLLFAPWIFIHLIGAEVLRFRCGRVVPVWYLSVSLLFMLINVGLHGTVYVLILPCALYLLSELRSCTIIWGTVLAAIFILNVEHIMISFDLAEGPHYMLFLCQAWTIIRSLNFSLDRIAAPVSIPNLSELITMLAYCFYFPTLILGPLLTYQNFKTGMLKPFQRWTLIRLCSLLLNFVRFSAWLIFTEIALHFVYSNSLLQQPKVVAEMGSWSLYGLGYCMGQFFMLKYVVMYGLMGTIARAENINAPRHPKCIARISLYSDMWRYFDEGLYRFLLRYIYIPCLGKNPGTRQKLMASLFCFTFVYIWHRTYSYVLIWSVLNFIGITVEEICKIIYSKTSYQYWERCFLKTSQNIRRFHALITTPLFVMSAISNFYFFGDVPIGNIYWRRLFEGSWQGNCTLFLLSYCCCQVSIEVKNREINKKLTMISSDELTSVSNTELTMTSIAKLTYSFLSSSLQSQTLSSSIFFLQLTAILNTELT